MRSQSSIGMVADDERPGKRTAKKVDQMVKLAQANAGSPRHGSTEVAMIRVDLAWLQSTGYIYDG
jgi:hypothetical protein